MATTNNIVSAGAGAIVFLRQLSHISISTTEASVLLKLLKGSDLLFENSYIPTSDGAIDIYDLDKELEPLLEASANNAETFTLVIGGSTYYVKVILCTADVNEDASDFVPDFFLCQQVPERLTAIGRYETLSLYATTLTTVSVVAKYWNGISKAQRTFSLPSVSVSKLGTLDVSPHNFANSSLGSLIEYEVQAGNRKAFYRVAPSLPSADPAIIFRNAFGCWEVAYFCGVKKKECNTSRSSAIINGEHEVYDIADETQWVASSGPIPHGYEDVFSDLAHSRYAYLLNADGTAGLRIAITDCDIKPTNEGHEQNTVSITYRMASRYGGTRVEGVRPPKLFDYTFDNTYN